MNWLKSLRAKIWPLARTLHRLSDDKVKSVVQVKYDMERGLQAPPEILAKEIILEDFMSYEYARVPIKPGLNVITGPNGSGKSSILVGISVALGQTYTERSKKLADLIRRGAEAARVSIVFDNSPKNGRRPIPFSGADDFIVSRYIKSDGSYWFEAGRREVSKLELSSILGRFGINPNDSLIIMHQNMIENFTSLSPQEVLKLFEDAIGLSPLRQSLIEAKKRLEEIKGPSAEEIEGGKRNLSYWNALHEKYLKKLELRKRLNEIDGELAWLRLKETRQALESYKTKLSEIEEEINENLNKKGELEKNLKKIRADAEAQDADPVNLIERAIDLAFEDGKRTEIIRQLKESVYETKSRVSKLSSELEGLMPEVAKWPEPANLRGESEINREKLEVQAILQSLSDVDEGTEESYSRVNSQLEDLLKKAREVEENRRAVMDEISYREKLWINNVKSLVEEVGQGYKEVLANVGGSGYLKLTGVREGGSPEEAGLELYAGFRGTNAVKLNPFTHSGGERSVTIMAFLISLQQHVLSPIRAVDEFDVHMDPSNKEAISRVLMSALSRKKNVEYIYITPGPLPPLPGDVHVLLVQKIEGKSWIMEAD